MTDTRHRRRHRDILWHAQDGKCFYCGNQTKLPTKGALRSASGNLESFATVEHRHPRARHTGVRSGLENKVMTCGRCNNRKGLMLEQVWMLVRTDEDLTYRLGAVTHRLHMLGLTEVRDAIMRNR